MSRKNIVLSLRDKSERILVPEENQLELNNIKTPGFNIKFDIFIIVT